MIPLKKETENTSKWKNLPFSWHSKIDIAKMVILPKMTLFNTIIIKISITFLTELEKRILKSIWRHRRLQAVNEGILNFKLPHKTRITKPAS